MALAHSARIIIREENGCGCVVRYSPRVLGFVGVAIQ